MTYSLHPGAEQDIADALDFYAEHAGPVVAARFLDEFERVARLLIEHPDVGTPTTKGRRIFPLRVFPYSVVYRSLDAGIRIIVVRHQHRKPNHGGGRL
jgi:plasmid stabilization system protein ParE